MHPLKIIVTVKQVPDTNQVKIDPVTNSLVREGVPSIINPEDRNAIEVALWFKEHVGAETTALCMGPPQAVSALEEALAMGIDKAVLLSDRAFAGSDTLVTAFTLSRAVMKIGTYDLILCGRQAIDGDTAQVGPQLAGFLGLPQITYAEEIQYDGMTLTIRRGLEDSNEWIRVKLPALVTVSAGINRPRHPSLYNIVAACDPERITRLTATDLKVPAAMLGLTASPTKVKKIFEPERHARAEMLEGEPSHMARQLIEKLRALHALDREHNPHEREVSSAFNRL
ncbi:MAG: electron transfer flavoprotein subunit beta/FixA family protein [Desulfobacterota bacterium]|nr:electron transfer flavoprotein subunit beta/FixA family protein [Thermodesulfobacteriota bacterium]